MPDKDIMTVIKQREDARPWLVLDQLSTLPNPGGTAGIGQLVYALNALAVDWRATADLYERAKLKGATTTYIVPLRHAAAELDKVIKGLEQPRGSSIDTEPRSRTSPCLDRMPHERHPNGTGIVTGDTLYCLGVGPVPDLTGLDALIASAKAEGRGTVHEATTFPGQATAEEVTAYLRGDADDIPGSAPLAPSGVRSLAELKAEAGAQLASAEEIAAAGLVLDPNGSEHGPDDRNYSPAFEVHIPADAALRAGLTAPPNPESAMRPIQLSGPALIPTSGGGRTAEPISAEYAHRVFGDPHAVALNTNDLTIPPTWETDTMTADGHRPPGVIPATPLLGQPGDAGSGYSPTYVPPGGIPMSYAELMTPIPAAILPPHISHSQIGTVGECPTKYRATRLDRPHAGPDGAGRAAPVTEIPQWALIGGSAFHAWVEAWERSVAAGDPRWADPFTPEDAAFEWGTVFGEEIARIESTSPVPRSMWRGSKGGAEGETWWNANGPLMLARYLAARPAESTWEAPTGVLAGRDLAIELERIVDVQTPYGPLAYKAIIDRVTVRDPGPGDNWITLIIRDYKSGDRMPLDTSQLGEYGQVLRLLGVPPQVKILGSFFNARKGVWTAEVDLEAEGWTADWFTHLVSSGHAGRLALTTGPTPARPTSYCGGCPVRWACPVKGVKQ